MGEPHAIINLNRFATDHTLGKWLHELRSQEMFEAQLEIENRLLASSRAKLESLSLDTTTLALEFTRVRSEIDAIKRLQSLREQMIENRNGPTTNRNPALTEKKRDV